ncbi:15892_t:CDS:1, partial [Gigaspora rosea]
MTLLKSYKLDLILIQEINLHDYAIRNFLAQQWTFNSFWTSKTAILAGRKEINLEEIKESYNGRVLSARFNFKRHSYMITNVYAPPNIEDRVTFFNSWSPQIDEEAINIIARDFNVNLNPYENRISRAEPYNDPS